MTTRAQSRRDREQVRTTPVTWREIIMGSDAFACGVADVRAGLGFRRGHEPPPKPGNDGTDWQWNYERGRQWAVIAGPDVPFFDQFGRIDLEAVVRILSDSNDIL
jgi:hypothetical protein